MPIYMDRHDMEGATAKAVADAHQKDLKSVSVPVSPLKMTTVCLVPPSS